MSFPFVKGHGTHNDFIVLPDVDGTVHGDLAPDVVAALCDRRGGIGADGVLRVLRGDVDGGADWFMDYRNADGSVSEMCGNGIRVFARYLADAGLVDVGGLAAPLPIDTRDGIKLVTFCEDGEISVDMGNPKVAGDVTVSVEGHAMPARKVDMGNPHAVVVVDDLASVGALVRSPYFCSAEYPDGVNIEFVVHVGDRHLAMRVFERGSGETWSCGNGACAVVAAAVTAAAETATPVAASAGSGGDRSDSDKSDGDRSGGDRSGGDKSDSDRSDSDRSDSDRSDSDRSGGDKSDSDRSDSDRSDSDRSDSDRSGGSDRAHVPASYRVDVPGGTLTVTWDVDDHIHLKGDAVLVATGTWTVQEPHER